jgi:hypothetical protein
MLAGETIQGSGVPADRPPLAPLGQIMPALAVPVARPGTPANNMPENDALVRQRIPALPASELGQPTQAVPALPLIDGPHGSFSRASEASP